MRMGSEKCFVVYKHNKMSMVLDTKLKTNWLLVYKHRIMSNISVSKRDQVIPFVLPI